MKQKTDTDQLIHESYRRSRWISISYFLYLTGGFCLAFTLCSVDPTGLMPLLCLGYGILAVALAIWSNRKRRQERQYRSALGDMYRKVVIPAQPTYDEKPKRDFLSTSDGTPLEIIEDENAPLNLWDDEFDETES